MEIRLFRDGDKQSLLSLLQIAFEGWHSDPFWDWLYRNNPQGKSSIGVAVDGEDVVASYSVCPVPVIMGRVDCTIGLGIDAATHPRYRRRGLFEKVATTAFADAESRGFPYILGYSEWGRPAAQAQVNKLGFSKVFAVKRLVKVLSWPRIFAFKMKLPVQPPSVEQVSNRIEAVIEERTNLEISILSRSDIKGDLFTTNTDDSVVVSKSGEYVQWRYFDNPANRYLLFTTNTSSRSPAFSALTLRQEHRNTVGVIVDIIGNPE